MFDFHLLETRQTKLCKPHRWLLACFQYQPPKELLGSRFLHKHYACTACEGNKLTSGSWSALLEDIYPFIYVIIMLNWRRAWAGWRCRLLCHAEMQLIIQYFSSVNLSWFHTHILLDLIIYFIHYSNKLFYNQSQSSMNFSEASTANWESPSFPPEIIPSDDP